MCEAERAMLIWMKLKISLFFFGWMRWTEQKKKDHSQPHSNMQIWQCCNGNRDRQLKLLLRDIYNGNMPMVQIIIPTTAEIVTRKQPERWAHNDTKSTAATHIRNCVIIIYFDFMRIFSISLSPVCIYECKHVCECVGCVVTRELQRMDSIAYNQSP